MSLLFVASVGELGVDGFQIMTVEEYEAYLKAWREVTYPYEYYYANTFFIIDSFADLQQHIRIFPITEDEAQVLEKAYHPHQLRQEGYGLFPKLIKE